MSSKSNNYGRAFEYACITNLQARIGKVRAVVINEKSIIASKSAWNTIDEHDQNTYIRASNAFIDTLFSAEPLIFEQNNSDDIVILSINRDTDAEKGDVRDIIIARENIRWNIGLSLKHNHFATKHSRLSASIDFGAKWYNVPCSSNYWSEVRPIFNKLDLFKASKIAWRDVLQKEDNIYLPIINAFIKEIKRAYSVNSVITTNFISYLLGFRDFYKVIAIDAKQITEFQAFNLRGELNKPGKKTEATVLIPKTDLPTEIISIRLKPNFKNTAELYLNNGWSFSFRIHNESTIVEPSLKFDIQFLGIPASIVTINCRW